MRLDLVAPEGGLCYTDWSNVPYLNRWDDDRQLKLHEFETKLHAKTIPLRGMGHFGSADGVFEVPFIRDLILDIK